MYNRIDLPVQRSAAAGLVAGLPWILLILASCVLTATIHWLWFAPVPLLVVALGNRWRRCGSLSHPQAVVRLTVYRDCLTATLACGQTVNVQAAADSRVVGPLLVLSLNAMESRSCWPLILLAGDGFGNVASEGLRRLRVWLRLMPAMSAPISTHIRPAKPVHTQRPGEKDYVRDA